MALYPSIVASKERFQLVRAADGVCAQRSRWKAVEWKPFRYSGPARNEVAECLYEACPIERGRSGDNGSSSVFGRVIGWGPSLGHQNTAA